MSEFDRVEEVELNSIVWSCAIHDFLHDHADYLEGMFPTAVALSAQISETLLRAVYRRLSDVPDGVIGNLGNALRTMFVLGVCMTLEGSKPKITHPEVHKEKLTRLITPGCNCRGCRMSREVLRRLGIEYDSSLKGVETDKYHSVDFGLSEKKLGEMLSKVFGGKFVVIGDGVGIVIPDAEEGKPN